MHRSFAGLAASCLLIGATGAVLAAEPSSPTGGEAGDGRIVYAFAAPGGSSHVFTVRPDGTDVTQVAPFEADWAVPSPDGSRLAMPQPLDDGRVTTALVRWDGSDLRSLPLPDDGGLSLAPSAWSPDGSRIALEGWSDADASANGIQLLDIEHETITRLTTVESPYRHDVPVGWSPDGTALLVLRLPDDGDRGDLFALGIDDLAWRRLTPEGQTAWLNGFSVPGTWSPDGGSIAFVAFDGQTPASAVYVVDAAGGEPVRVSAQGRYATGARFSPDGRWVLYDMDPNGGGVHYVDAVRPDGTEEHAITDRETTGSGTCCGTWSPDGDHVLFQDGDASAAHLWTVAADGTDPRQLTTEAGGYVNYSWGLLGG